MLPGTVDDSKNSLCVDVKQVTHSYITQLHVETRRISDSTLLRGSLSLCPLLALLLLILDVHEALGPPSEHRLGQGQRLQGLRPCLALPHCPVDLRLCP